MPKTVVLGQGRMGSAMAVRLRESGVEVTVWNRDPKRCEAAHAAGARVADAATDAVAEAEVVLVMLADGDTVAAVLSAVAPVLPRCASVVQMSTIAPQQTRRLAEAHPRLPLLDAPVKGSVPQVRAGTLEILIGGEPAAVERARPVLERLGSIVDCGGVGGGSAAKLVVNAAMISAVTSLAESLRLAAGLGIGEKPARELLAASPLGSVLERHVPSGGDFPLYLAAKDVRLAAEATPDATVLDAVRRRLSATAAPDPEAGLWTVVSQALEQFSDANRP